MYLSFCLSIIFLLGAYIASGQIRLQYNQEQETEGKTVILLDVSRSMNIRDINGDISRLDTAKNLIEGYISNNSHLIGITIFAGEGRNILPLNAHRELTLKTLRGLNYQSVGTQGSRLDRGVRASLTLFGDELGGNLIIFTDQDSHEGNDFIREIQSLRDIIRSLDITVTLVGVGTDEGGKIEIGRDAWGQTEYQTYRGEIVRAPLEEDFLNELSSFLGAKYINYNDFNIGVSGGTSRRSQLHNIGLSLIYLIVSLLNFVAGLLIMHRVNYLRFHKKIKT